MFFCLITFTSFSQKNKFHTSYIGITVQPSHYWLYNKDEFTAVEDNFGIKNDSIMVNGLSYGITYGHFLKKSTGINIQFLYTTQTQYYKAIKQFTGHTNLQYFKIPFEFIYRKELVPDNYIFFKSGIQLSYLTEALDYSESKSLHNYTYIDKNNTMSGTGFTPEPDRKYFFDWRYNRFILGTVLSVGYEYYLNNKISINIGLTGNIDLTNIDNTGALEYIYQTNENGDIIRQTQQYNVPRWNKYRIGYGAPQYDRKPSHNIHLGLEFGFKYWFGEKALVIERKIPREW